MDGFDQKLPCQDCYNFENERKFEHIERGQIWAVHFRTSLRGNTHRYARVNLNSKEAVCVTWLKPIPASASERRWCDAGLPVACGSFDLGLELTCDVSWSRNSSYSYKCSWVQGVVGNQFEIYPKKGEIWAVYRNWNIDDEDYGCDYVKQCTFDLVEITSDFSKYTGVYCEYLVKVDGFRYIFERTKIGVVAFHIRPGMFYMFSHKVPAYRFVGGEIDKFVEGMFELDRLALPNCMINDIDAPNIPKTEKMSSFLLIVLPLSHVQWTSSEAPLVSKRFARGQIWAVNCRKDLMPRQYTRVDSVISESQVRATLLEPLTVLDSESESRKAKLPIVCGVFKPLRGEIWAMYKNWNKKWERYEHEAYQCQVVQILSDMSEGDGIRIARLEEVKGYLTFFQEQKDDGFDPTCVVSNAEALSFSHRIPAFRVPGIGKRGIPDCAWHLEPNALPPRRGDQFQLKPHGI
ncbi:hypothetical protein PanWU01x14_104030 [Parasponia andersonii]|uniref:DUF3444 domain-containing protein n=1 Tax=Parasponia andersonii TaxID=3476 RepID=A0A2P5D1R0_PARAD|nr:hypothetical protein PanWU01x14_104030 [Parasponia andersonii]